jgi:glucosamine kinase
VSARLVGLDVGGSKTALRAVDEDGAVVIDVVAPTDRWRGEDMAAKAEILLSLIADRVDGTVTALAVGAHGCDTDDQCAELAAALRDRAGIPVTVVNDAQLLVHALGLPDAIGVIAGTGSIAVGRTPSGETVHAGGWGWLVGDDGGASGIVRETVREGLRNADAGIADAVLERHLTEQSALGELGDVSFSMMLTRPEEWARLSPAVFRAATDGSPIASRILERAARSLATLVDDVARKGASTEHVVLGGGVVRAQPDFARTIERFVLAAHPAAHVSVLTDAPVAGAVALASSLLDSPLPLLTPNSPSSPLTSEGRS